MNAEGPNILDALCPTCGAALSGNAECPRCGHSVGDEPSSQRDTKRRWEENPKLIILMMVFAALFLGFPFLWRSREMSLGSKILWTVLVSIETVVLFWLFFWFMATYTIPPIREALGW